jgi:hypothetical protein
MDLLTLLTPSRLLTLSGITLSVLGIAGISGLLRRLSSASLFNPPAWIHWVHVAVGIALLAIVYAGNEGLERGIVSFGAIAGTLAGGIGLIFGRRLAKRFHKPEIADPSEHLAHLAVGLLALWACAN